MKKITSTILLFLTAAIWGFAFVAQRQGADVLDSFTYNGVRFTLGALSLLPVVLIFERDSFTDRRKFKKTVLAALPIGVILFTASWLQQWGVEITGSAGKAGFITGLYTVFVPIAGVFFKRMPKWNMWLGAICAVVGLFLLSVNEDFTVGWGDAVLLIGAVFWAMHVIAIDRSVNGVGALMFSFVQFAVCAALSLICAFIFEDVTVSGIVLAKWPLLYGGIMSVGVAYTFQVLGQREADPNHAAIIFSTESVFAAIGGAVLLHEMMTGRGYVGCALIFFGIVISQLKFKGKKEKSKDR